MGKVTIRSGMRQSVVRRLTEHRVVLLRESVLVRFGGRLPTGGQPGWELWQL